MRLRLKGVGGFDGRMMTLLRTRCSGSISSLARDPPLRCAAAALKLLTFPGSRRNVTGNASDMLSPVATVTFTDAALPERNESRYGELTGCEAGYVRRLRESL